MGYLSGYWTLCILLTGFVALVKGQCDGSTQKLSDQNNEISSPNFNDGGEYNKSANCSWEFSPRSDAKEYALVLTVKQMRLYAVKSGTEHCLGSYNLSINEEQTNCLRYVGKDGADDSLSLDFCSAFYSSPACANISQSQGCEKTLQTPYPVSVTYYSDGRTDPDVASASMYFKIDYKFIACPADENETGTQMPSSNSTRSNSISNFTAESNSGSRQGVTISIAASAGGGCLVLIAGIAVMLFLRKRKRKLDISTGRRDQDLPMEEIDQSNDSTGSNTAKMAGKPIQSNQTKPTEDTTAEELYATVSKPPEDKKSRESAHSSKDMDEAE